MSRYEQCAPLREQVAYFMRRLYRQGLTTCSGGNISLRLGRDTALVTPSAVDKGELKGDEIALFTMAGENLTPHLKGSIETGMHLAVLKARPDVNAVVHAHPVTATSFTAMDMDINFHLTAEAFAVLGTPKRAPYCLMGSDGLAKIVADTLADTDVALMQNHGVIAVGKTLLNAFDKLEVTEAAAKMTWITSTLKAASALGGDQLDEITRVFRS